MNFTKDVKIESQDLTVNNLQKIKTSLGLPKDFEKEFDSTNNLINQMIQHNIKGTIYTAKSPKDLFSSSNTIIAYLVIEGEINNKESKAIFREFRCRYLYFNPKLLSLFINHCIQDYKRNIFINDINKRTQTFYESVGFVTLTSRCDKPELSRGIYYYKRNKPIQVFHESPIKLFNYSSKYNDYLYILQFCLNNIKYKDYIISELQKSKMVIFDNSAFEYGLNLPTDETFAANIRQLSSFTPDKTKFYFIVNDYLNEKDKTIQSMQNWIKNYGNLGCKIIGTIQGKTIQELIECYKFMSDCPAVDKIAIPCHSTGYSNMFSDINNKLCRYVRGRQYLISRLVEDDLWNFNKPHHLLGASLINEFSNPLYKKLTIESIDTSNPVVCALHNIQYDAKFGNTSKPSTKLCDLLETDVTEEQKKLLDFNIKVFKEILK